MCQLRANLIAYFAYRFLFRVQILKSHRIPFEDLAYDLKPEQIWLAVQAIHGLPLAPFEPSKMLQVTADDEGAVAYCDKFSEAAEAELRSVVEKQPFVVVYAYTPRPIRDALDGANNIEVRAIPDYLIKRFQG